MSTNVLSLVPLVTGRLDSSAELEALVEERERPALRLLIRVVFAYERLDLLDE